jgi:hypothetical protein
LRGLLRGENGKENDGVSNVEIYFIWVGRWHKETH